MEVNRDFEAEGFLKLSPGREFQIQGHNADNRSGLVAFSAVVKRDDSDDMLGLGKKHGLQLFAEFDDAHPSLVLLEAVGEVNFVEQLAKDLTSRGYQRLSNVA